MGPLPLRVAALLPVVVPVVAMCSLVSCGGAGQAPVRETASQTASPQAAQAPPGAPAASVTVQAAKACALLTKADVETAAGLPVLDPIEQTMAELSTCTFGDPDAPKVAGRPLSNVASLAVFSGGTAYFAGPVAQARGVYETAVKGAGAVEEVSGLGDNAHWAGRTLRILRGPYMIEVEVDVEKDAKKIAQQLAKIVTGRLP